jgi:hypothetical protein
MLSQLSFAQQYDINDPRNPDCPCHKNQQLAEREYAALIKNDDRSIHANGNKISSLKKNNLPESITENSAEKKIKLQKIQPAASYTKTKRKHKQLLIGKLKFRFYNGKKGLKKVKGNNSDCFHW